MIARLQSLKSPLALDAARAWIDTRSRREQLLLAGLAVIAAVAVVWYGLTLPLLHARAAATARIETAAELSSRLRNAGPGAPVLQTQASNRSAIAGDAATILTRRAAASGLSAGQVTPDGNGAGIVIDSARYDAVIPYVAAVEGADGVAVQSLKIDSAGQPGLVRLEMQVSQP